MDEQSKHESLLIQFDMALLVNLIKNHKLKGEGYKTKDGNSHLRISLYCNPLREPRTHKAANGNTFTETHSLTIRSDEGGRSMKDENGNTIYCGSASVTQFQAVDGAAIVGDMY